MKAFKQIKELPHDDLRKKRDEVYKELVKDRAQVAIGTVPKNPGKIKLARKTIARINMILATEGKKQA